MYDLVVMLIVAGLAQLQVVCESYLDGIDIKNPLMVKPKLLLGNNRTKEPGNEIHGATRFTESQATWFFANYDIIDHYANDASGFSCTLMRRKNGSDEENGVYTLSMRSTEFQFNSKGGDWSRDGKPGADGQINDNGYALAQLSAMEAYFKDLYSGKRPAAIPTKPINVTGYSLSGNLASALALMHSHTTTARQLHH